ncbi:MAG TPA: TadE/TadG family type IV pilus assembly protein [Candidatus Cybelea sp.]|jgi:Flp pilus assembly protein TadG|nr:TadE/TadG family type IV pilus assembly protein [Candidatus Cybelea sp.]
MRKHGERGSSMVEMAIAAGALLAIILGVVDFGRAMYTYGYVAQLARQGARWAIVRGSTCTVIDHCNAGTSDVNTYVQSLAEGMTPANSNGSLSATATWPNSCKTAGCTVSVSVTYPFKFIGVLPGAVINMSSTSQMVISQ